MRKKLFIAFALLAPLSLTSCFSDDSSEATTMVSDIVIDGIERNYTKTAYIGEHLQIQPTITTDYAEADMDYQWLLLDAKTGSASATTDTIPPVVIGREKNLDYVVAIQPGQYQIRLVAQSKTNRYTAFKTSTLVVQTNFSSGWYILKETADGNTELDQLNPNGEMGYNLLAGVKGAALQGKPRMLNINYEMNYINPNTDAIEKTNALTITTEANDINVSRTSDLMTIFDRHSLLFEDMEADEKPYGIMLTGVPQQIYLSSKGMRKAAVTVGNAKPTSSGKFGMPVNKSGGSPFFVHDLFSYGGGYLWDETSKSLFAINYNNVATPLTYKDKTGADICQNLKGFECLTAGYSFTTTGDALFLLENTADQKRYLYRTVTANYNSMFLKSRTEVAAGSHLAKATAFAVNGNSAQYLYCVEGGKVYACLFASDNLSEVALTTEGIPADETITYVGNQYWLAAPAKDAFDYLVVGTQKGNDYKVYLYKMVGGAPTGQPVLSFGGTGKPKTIKYLSNSFNPQYWEAGINGFNPLN